MSRTAPPRPRAARLRRWAYGLLALVLAVPLALALGLLIPRGTNEGAGQGARLLVLSGLIHTDIALPLDEATRARFAFLEEAGVPIHHPDARWLLLGWGGRSFYLGTPTWADLRPGPVLRSLGGDASVLHVDVAGRIDEAAPGVLPLDLSPEARTRVEDAILATFSRREGRTQPIPDAGYGWSDRFFEAEGGFNLLLGCNTWTAEVLRAGGLRTGVWTPLPATLLASLRLHAPPPRAAAP
jgi:uncharacterized protein (TIGR02117 family)